MPMGEYQGDLDSTPPSLSASIANLLCSSSPLHAWTAHPRLNPDFVRESSTEMDNGTIAHALMLEGMDIAEVIDADSWRTKEARQARDEARAKGNVPILKKHYDDICRMVEAGWQQLGAHPGILQAPGKAEHVMIWQESNGVWCRCRPDYLHDDHRFIDDLKTRNGSANPDVISRTMFNEGWDVTAAFYLRGLRMIDPNCDPRYRFVCMETFAPYALSVNALGPDALMLAEKKVLWAIEKFGQCLESGIWPGYPTDVCYASLPVYLENQWLQKESKEVKHAV